MPDFIEDDGVVSSVAESTFSKAEPRKYGVRMLKLGESVINIMRVLGRLYLILVILKFLKTGVSNDFNLTMADKTDGYALAFTGYLDVKEPGLYTFRNYQ